MRKRERLIFGLKVEKGYTILTFYDEKGERYIVGRYPNGEYVGWRTGHSFYLPEEMTRLLVLHAFPETIPPS